VGVAHFGIINKPPAVECIKSYRKRRDAYAAQKTAWGAYTYVGRQRDAARTAFAGLGFCFSRGNGGCRVLYIVFLIK